MANPSSIINLANWKLTLPTGKKGKPKEITQPALNTYSDSNFNVSGSNVLFTAPTGGVTTSGSSYPRSELREMKPNGNLASWSNRRKTRILDVTAAFVELPSGKREVVACQIHGGSDDITGLLLSGTKLYVRVGDTQRVEIDSSYTLGTSFTFRYKARPGGIECWYDGALVHTISGNFSGCYFKAGCYTQANKTNGSGKGVVAISSLTLDGAAPLAVPPATETVEDEPRPVDPPEPMNPCGP